MKALKQLLCVLLFGVSAALCTVGCASVCGSATCRVGINPNDPLLQDNLIEETEGGPVVAPTTPYQQQESDKTGGTSHFGEEHYIWENW